MEGVYLSNRGFYVPAPVFESGFWIVVAAFLAGIAGTILFRRWAKKRQAETGQIYPVFTIGTAAILGLPVIAFFLAGMPASLDQPALATLNIRGGMVLKPEFPALWFALSVYTSSFITAIVRSGIHAASHRQTQAAATPGLRPNWPLRLLIL